MCLFNSLRLARISIMHSSLKFLPQHFNQVEVWALTGPLQHRDSFLFWSGSCRFTVLLGIIAQFQLHLSDRQPHIVWLIEEFMVNLMTVRCRFCCCKIGQIITPPPQCCGDLLRLVFTKNCALHYVQTSPLSGLDMTKDM